MLSLAWPGTAAEHLELAAGGWDQTEHHVQQGGLARRVGSDDRDDAAGRDREARLVTR